MRIGGTLMFVRTDPCQGLSTRDAIHPQVKVGDEPLHVDPKGPTPLKIPRLEGKVCRKKDLLVTPALKHKDSHPPGPSTSMGLDLSSVLTSPHLQGFPQVYVVIPYPSDVRQCHYGLLHKQGGARSLPLCLEVVRL